MSRSTSPPECNKGERQVLRIRTEVGRIIRWTGSSTLLGRRIRRGAVATPVAVALLAGSCDSSVRRDSVLATITDSAGAQHVDFARLPSGAGSVRLANRPDFVLGGLQENDSLEFDVRGVYLSATALADGQIVVGDHQRLKFFNTRGQLTRIVGRGGLGPGEFTTARDLCPQSDSTLVVIDDDGRWTHWDRNGNLRRSQARLGFVPNGACSTHGTVLVQEPSLDGAFSATTRRTLRYSLHRADGSELQSVGRLAAPEYFGPLFFEPSFAMLGKELLIAEPHHFEWRTQSLATGLTTTRWRVKGASRPLTDVAWDSLIETGFPSNATAEQRRKRLSRLRELGKPVTYPAFWKVRVDPSGRIWINPYFDHLHWYVVDNGGTRMSLITLPLAKESRPQLVGFAGTLVVVRHVDDAGAAVLSFFPVLTSEP